MAQFARPDSDITTTGWTTAPLWSKIDESTASDADFIQSVFGTGNRAEVGLSDVTDPNQSSGHIVRFRGRITGTEPGELTVSLFQGTTQKATRNFGALSSSYFDYAFGLSTSEADSITDYSNLRLRFSGVAPGLGADMQCRITWAELEVPDPLVPVSSSHSPNYEALQFVSQEA